MVKLLELARAINKFPILNDPPNRDPHILDGAISDRSG